MNEEIRKNEEIHDDQLEAVSGGAIMLDSDNSSSARKCPKCYSRLSVDPVRTGSCDILVCMNCGYGYPEN